MRGMKVSLLLAGISLFCVLSLSGISSGADVSKYPDRTIELVVPFAAGGLADSVARVVAEHVSKDFAQPILVVNKTGAGGVTASVEVLLQTPPDGYKLMLMISGPTTTALALAPDIPYTYDQLTPIAQVSSSAIVFVVKDDSKWQKVKDVMEDVRKNPGNFKGGTAAIGGPLILALSQLFDSAGIDPNLLNIVVFPAGEAGVGVALAGGHVDFACMNYTGALSLIRAGKLRALVVTGSKQASQLPDVPTAAEVGYPGFSMTNWAGVIGPKGVSEHVVKRWNQAIQKTMKDEKFLNTLGKIGVVPDYLGPEAYMKVMKTTYDIAKYYVDKMGLKEKAKQK